MDNSSDDKKIPAEEPPCIQWDDTLVTGIGIIDEQHKHLIALANKVFKSNLQDTDDVIGMLDFLADYVVMHFKAEEDIMEKQGFEQLEKHREEHAYFISNFVKLRRYCQDSGIEPHSVLKIQDLVTDWLVTHHIHKTDRLMAEYLRTVSD